jgi:hypothetical protein
MGCRVKIYITTLLLTNCAHILFAQRVLYSPYLENHFEVAGKVGEYYWVETTETHQAEKKHPGKNDSVSVRNFEVYNGRMLKVNETDPYVMSPDIIKEYLIANGDYFDQLQVQAATNKTNILINRYADNGTMVRERATLLSFPFLENANSFLISRSEDKSKILVLCFESPPEGSMRLHAYLFDRNWKKLSYTVYNHLFTTQPFIQDDFTNYPIEYFNSNALKVTNTGQWLMVLPSRLNNNFALYHFNGKDSGFVYREIKSPIYAIWEDVALSVDNEKQELIASVLSSFRYPTLKNVEVVHYSLISHSFEFDSSFRFNTLMGYKIKDENLIHESFVAVPGAGFMLLKEYGRPYVSDDADEDYNSSRVLKFFFASNSISSMLKSPSFNKDGYTRYDKLGGTRKMYQRGDLCMFYFPGKRGDSCWSGIVNKEQTTEFNLPWLSYLVVPIQQKLFFLYNSFFRSEARYGNSTVLDYKGNLINDEGLVYWKLGHTLSFQQSRRISDNEMAIPFENNRKFGFAIIRF